MLVRGNLWKYVGFAAPMLDENPKLLGSYPLAGPVESLSSAVVTRPLIMFTTLGLKVCVQLVLTLGYL